VLPAIGDVIKGALRAGQAVADFLTWAAGRALETVVEVTKTLLEAGVTIGELLLDTMAHPDHAFQNLLRAFDELGQAFSEILDEAVQLGEDVLVRAVETAREIGRAIGDILGAALEIAGGLFGTVVSILFRLLASYRKMTAAEIADARTVFGDKLDYSKIYFASESLANDIVFGVQDFVTGNPESRAFVSDNLVNFDVDEGIERHTMIHELTHVWQFEFTGPFYMSEAIHAQVLGSGYNYGYDEGVGSTSITVDYAGGTRSLDTGKVTGEGGQTELAAAGGDLSTFNREQQGQILMHYFVRRVLLNEPVADYAPWQGYVDFVLAS
jgi:hypothetical protein